MTIAALPINEAERLEALNAYQAFQTGPEPGFDRITSLASRILGVPMAYVSLVGDDTQWLKSCFNLPGPQETSRDIAFCAHAILSDDVFVVPDTSEDPRFFDNPLVTGEPYIQFYLGCPLRSPSGHNIGTLCVVDRVPRTATPEMISTIKDLAAMVVDQLELRKWLIEEESRQRHSAETNYRRLSDAIKGMVFRVNLSSAKEFDYLYVSPGTRELLGVAPSEFDRNRMAFVERIHPDDLMDFFESAEATWNEKRHWSWTGRVITTAGVTKWVQGEGRFEGHPDGTGIVEGLVYDISESKEREFALNESKEVAEKANRAKSEFLSRMNHELRTPMNAILGFAQMLELAPLEKESQEDLAQVKKAGEHLLRLINEVLDLSSIEAKKVSTSIEPVRVADIVTESIGLLRPLFDSRQVRLRMLPDEEDFFVFADHQRFKQVVINLLTNAAKYNRTGGHISIGAFEKDGCVLLGISDEGNGIEPENLGRLFVPFDRLGAEGTGIEGTGLGLSISRGLVDLMGGTLSVESVVGEGSTFIVHLPKAYSPVNSLPQFTEELRSTPEYPAPRKVLYIEDNESNIVLVERIFQQRPEACLSTAKSLAEGRKRLEDSVPDLLLLDLNLPDGNGESMIRWIRSESKFPNLPIVVLTADATARQAEQVLAAGADNYLTKPLSIPVFLSVLDRSLNKEAKV